jgi:hypothetical protein
LRPSGQRHDAKTQQPRQQDLFHGEPFPHV